MDVPGLGDSLLNIIREHQALGPFIIGALAFGESIAVVSLFIPATLIMLGLGGVIGVGDLELWPFCLGASLGAILGDIVSYEVGRRYGIRVRTHWLLRDHVRVFAYGKLFFKKWGWLSLAVGRFIGPARAIVPLCAGMTRMNRPLFLTVTMVSAPFWAAVMLAPGAFGLGALF